MKKIISLFQRNYETDYLVRNEVVPGAEWVIQGEGIATRKWDGTCTMWDGRFLWKRYDAKHGKPTPPGFVPAQPPDTTTGHWPGWILIGERPEDRWHREGLASLCQQSPNGTYELCGPKIGGNPEKLQSHFLFRHGNDEIKDFPRDFESIKSCLEVSNMEGVVWHHPDGRMVKIRKKDFFR
jgi:Family of unknown function (DUF5565)